MKIPAQSALPARVANRSRALSRVDVVALIAVFTVLAAAALPVLAQSLERAELAGCHNNLRIIGIAFQTWSLDHDQRMPWRVLADEGGTQLVSRPGTVSRPGVAWAEFLTLSNLLDSPRVLACPSDTEARGAHDFSRSPDGGFLHFDYRNRSVSYFLGLDTFPDSPLSYLSGDRNLRTDLPPQYCSSGIINADTIIRNPFGMPTLEWTNNIHRGRGNILAVDGRVTQLSSETLRIDIARSEDNGSVHLLMPR